MPINQVIFLFRTGSVIYSKKLSEEMPDEELVSPFISAITTFAQHSFDTSDLSIIQVGHNMITIEPGVLGESEETSILGILISTGIDDSMAQAILSEMVEMFAINLDQIMQSNNISIETIQVGHLPDMSFIDEKIDAIIKKEHQKDFSNYDLSVSIPKRTTDLIQTLFGENPDIADLYHYKESALIEQMLLEYIYYDLEEKIKEKFLLKTDLY